MKIAKAEMRRIAALAFDAWKRHGKPSVMDYEDKGRIFSFMVLAVGPSDFVLSYFDGGSTETLAYLNYKDGRHRDLDLHEMEYEVSR